MSSKLRFVSLTDPGRERPENEDSCGSTHLEGLDFYYVCDGMGGHSAGAAASQLAVATLDAWFKEESRNDIPTRIEQGLVHANEAVHQEGQKSPEKRGMGTTAVVIAVEHESGKAWVGHVGDSRGYLVRGDTIRQITRDHSFVQRLVDDGYLAQEDAENHPQSNVIVRSLGGLPVVEPELGEEPFELQDGDTFVICSDGLHGLVSAAEIASHAIREDMDAAASELIALANERGGPDNITVQLIRWGGRGDEEPETWSLLLPPPAPGTRLAKQAEEARAAAEAAERGEEPSAEDSDEDSSTAATQDTGDNAAAPADDDEDDQVTLMTQRASSDDDDEDSTGLPLWFIVLLILSFGVTTWFLFPGLHGG